MKKLLPLLLLLLLLSGALLLLHPRPSPSLAESLTLSPESVTDWSRAIAYVPLDDRADNLEDVVYLAEAAGFQILLPPGDSYCTKLDGQAPNSSGEQYGDREALFLWLQALESSGCDLYLLSLDQLFSGGLVNSRALTASLPLSFPDGAVLSETEAFDRFLLPLMRDPENRLYLFDSVVRLASTVGYQGFGLTEYNALRAYGMVSRPVLEGDALTLENLFAAYPYAADGLTPAREELEDAPPELTDALISDYLSVRERKLRLTDHVLTALDALPRETTHLLIGIDDSSNAPNIQYNELNYLTRRNADLLPGLDSLARLLVTRLAQDLASAGPLPVHVSYVGGSEAVFSSPYDRYTLSETMALHLDYLNAHPVPEQDAALEILVMTAPRDTAQSPDCIEALLSRLESLRQAKRPVILIEASAGAYGDALLDGLLERVELSSLLAFSGRYYQANIVGAGLAMGFSRYLALAHPPADPAAQEARARAQVQQLANSLSLSYAHALGSRPELTEYAASLGLDPNNLHPSPLQSHRLHHRLEEAFLPRCRPLLENLESGGVPVSLTPYRALEVESVRIRDPYFPWNRVFELAFTVEAELEQ